MGLDKHDCHYILPVQAEGGTDHIGIVQTAQDIRFAEQKFPEMRCRAIVAQFMKDGEIALFELTLKSDEIRVVDERHYRLVPMDRLNPETIRDYCL